MLEQEELIMFKIENLRKYKGLIGSTRESVEAIQRFIEKNKNENIKMVEDEEPAASINKVLNAVIEEDNEIQNIINNL